MASSGVSRKKKQGKKLNQKPNRSKSSKTSNQKMNPNTGLLSREILVWVVMAISLILLVNNFGIGGKIGNAVSSFIFGLYGLFAWVFPFFLFFLVVFILSNKGNRVAYLKALAMLVLTFMISTFLALITPSFTLDMTLAECYQISSVQKKGGGLIGGMFAKVFAGAFGTVAAFIIIICLMFVCVIVISEKSLLSGLKKGGSKAKSVAKDRADQRREHRADQLYERKMRELDRQKLARYDDDEFEPEEEDFFYDEDFEEDPANFGDTRELIFSKRRRRNREQNENIMKELTFSPSGDGKQSETSSVDEKVDKENESACTSDKHEQDFLINLGERQDEQDFLINLGERQDERDPRTNLGGRQDERDPSDHLRKNAGIQTIQKESNSDNEHEPTGNSYYRAQGYNNPKRYHTNNFEEPVRDGEDVCSAKEDADIFSRRNRINAEDNYPGDTVFYHPEERDDMLFSSSENEDPIRLDADPEPDQEDAGKELFNPIPDQKDAGKELFNPIPGEKSFQNLTRETGEASDEDAFLYVEPENVKQDYVEQEDLEPVFSKPVRADSSYDRIGERDFSDITCKTKSHRNDDGDIIIGAGFPVHNGAEDVAVMGSGVAVSDHYRIPPLELLELPSGKNKGMSRGEVDATAEKLKQTLASFGVGTTITNVCCGPSVTRYELQPDRGVKVSKILSLSDDIKLNLAAADIRIEAPIPGKAAIGIEVPNSENMTVTLGSLIGSEEFRSFHSKIAFAVGQDISGKTIIADIFKMPHLLIGGATGSGKSVCINTLIISILYKAKPDEVKFIMIDPKMIELNLYNGIPHLYIPVVTDPRKAAGALQWAVAEMTKRYQAFSVLGVRDLKGYNAKIQKMEYGEGEKPYEKMPQIVIVVDEFADLMMVASGDVEEAVCRLAQLARAAGIHLILATQRPSVDVITGLIKANMPSRIALSVSSGTDSRTIIDMNGAEKLLGKGDMLFYPAGLPKPIRVQGAFVSEEEVERVVEFIKNQNGDAEYDEEVENQVNANAYSSGKGAPVADISYDSGNDEYFEEAARYIVEKEKASIGSLQRVFKIGFNRAARIMDQLSDAGVVGPEEGTKPRRVLMTMSQLEAYLNGETEENDMNDITEGGEE